MLKHGGVRNPGDDGFMVTGSAMVRHYDVHSLVWGPRENFLPPKRSTVSSSAWAYEKSRTFPDL